MRISHLQGQPLVEPVLQGKVDIVSQSAVHVVELCSGCEEMVCQAGCKTLKRAPVHPRERVLETRSKTIDICAQIEQSNKIVAHDIAFQLDRRHVPNTEIYSYRLRISFAYVPKKAGIRQDQTQDVESVTVAKYCPLNENEREKKYNQDRVSAGVVCSKVEVML